MTQQTTTLQRDPVCGMDVDPTRAAARSAHGGNDYYFCSAGCKARFDHNPEQYLDSGPRKSGGCCCS